MFYALFVAAFVEHSMKYITSFWAGPAHSKLPLENFYSFDDLWRRIP
jgi:hypothetical protein